MHGHDLLKNMVANWKKDIFFLPYIFLCKNISALNPGLWTFSMQMVSKTMLKGGFDNF